MDYAVGDLLRECKNQWDYEKDCWRDYGMGIITHIDITKEIATIYWFELQACSFYKFRNMRRFLEPISQPRA